MNTLLDIEEFPRCPVCRGREAHASEMIDISKAITTPELRPAHPVLVCRECANG